MIGRSVLIVVVALTMLWLTMAITSARLFEGRASEFALGWGLRDAWAEAAQAERILGGDQAGDSRIKARRIATGALERDASVAAASSTLALIADLEGDQAEARRLFRYSEVLSRRDVATQLWLLEDQVRRDDITGALVHYDRALRVSNGTRDLLLPILVKASADSNVARPLATFLARRPPWWRDFLPRLLADGGAPDSISLLVASLGLRPADEGERIYLQQAMTRLVALGDLDHAYALYRSVKPAAETRSTIRNGDFDKYGGLAPFDWAYVDQVGFGSFRQLREDAQDVALYINNSEGRRGEVARQLVLLAPGHYRVTGRAGGISGEEISRPSIGLTCTDAKHGQPLLFRLPAAPARGISVEKEFEVPAGCKGQWLSIITGVGSGSGSNAPWVDTLAIDPVAD